MGATTNAQTSMRTTALLVSALALTATVFALPSSDGVVPEEVLVQEDAAAVISRNDALLQTEARAHAEEMLRKNGANACADLAESTMDTVKQNVAAAQDLINKLNNGAECEHTGQAAVQKAEQALTDAKSAQENAQNDHDQASKAMVDFGKIGLDQLSESSCSIFFNSKNYKDAKAKRQAAKTKLDQAKGVTNGAETALSNAKKEAQKKAQQCACDTKDMHAEELVKANEKVQAANIQAWSKAHHLKCVLDGVSASNCKVPAVPEVKAAQLSTFANAAQCAIAGRLEDNCHGWAVDGSACGNGKVGYQIFSGIGEYKYYQQGRPELYQCPKGWHWAKDAEYFNYMHGRGCYSNNAQAQNAMLSYTDYKKQVYSLFQSKKQKNCGWTNYNPPNGPANRYYVIPSDFGKTTNFASSGCSFNPNLDYNTPQPCHGRYQHLGNYAGYQSNTNTNVNNGHWAGIICMKD